MTATTDAETLDVINDTVSDMVGKALDAGRPCHARIVQRAMPKLLEAVLSELANETSAFEQIEALIDMLCLMVATVIEEAGLDPQATASATTDHARERILFFCKGFKAK